MAIKIKDNESKILDIKYLYTKISNNAEDGIKSMNPEEL